MQKYQHDIEIKSLQAHLNQYFPEINIKKKGKIHKNDINSLYELRGEDEIMFSQLMNS